MQKKKSLSPHPLPDGMINALSGLGGNVYNTSRILLRAPYSLFADVLARHVWAHPSSLLHLRDTPLARKRIARNL